MATRHIAQQQPRGGAVAAEGGKKKNGAPKGNNRRALGDIGNLVTVQGIDIPKPKLECSRPLTRSFCAQLLANAQAAAALENKNKSVAVVVDGDMVAKDGAIAKAAHTKATSKPKPNEVIEISPDTVEETEKEKSVSRTSSKGDTEEKAKKEKCTSGRKGGLSKKKVQTLTSVLTARSKAACGITGKPKDPIINIDETDLDDPVVDYVEDLYKFYKLTENSSRVNNYIDSQPDINEKMRAILVDWLIEVHNKFELMPETLYLTIHVVDHFLSMKLVSRRELQLVGISAMLIASKYEEIWAPEVSDFVCISDLAYTREQILVMEKSILGKLEWNLTVPTPYVFLVRFIKAAVPNQEMEKLVFFMAELGLMHYETIMYCPSMVAASAVYAARCTLNKSPLWSETLKFYTGYSEIQLLDCAKLLVNFHLMAAENKLKSIYKKYLDPQHCSVALLPPAKNLLTAR